MLDPQSSINFPRIQLPPKLGKVQLRLCSTVHVLEVVRDGSGMRLQAVEMFPSPRSELTGPCNCRFVLGEGMTKKSSNLASEVEEQTKALQSAAAEKKEEAPAAPAPEAIKDEDVPDFKVCTSARTLLLLILVLMV